MTYGKTLVLLLSFFMQICAMHKDAAKKPVIINSTYAQVSRPPSPAIFDCIERILCFSTVLFSFEFLQKPSLASSHGHTDEETMVPAMFDRFTRVSLIRSSSEDLLYEKQPTIADLIEHVHEQAEECQGPCAAVLTKKTTSVIIAYKNKNWFFASLDYQGAEQHFAPGSHLIFFYEDKKALIKYVENLCNMFDMHATPSDPNRDEWQATLYGVKDNPDFQ